MDAFTHNASLPPPLDAGADADVPAATAVKDPQQAVDPQLAVLRIDVAAKDGTSLRPLGALAVYGMHSTAIDASSETRPPPALHASHSPGRGLVWKAGKQEGNLGESVRARWLSFQLVPDLNGQTPSVKRGGWSGNSGRRGFPPDSVRPVHGR